MTISDETLFNVRDEYPDLDIEIRSILLTHAQNGATISQIKEDYHKVTGMKFPINHDITDFLLTIPLVTAYCNEHGTRIFNVMPSVKTKHIHDMVQQQKPQLQQHYPKQVPICIRNREQESRLQSSGEPTTYSVTNSNFGYGQTWNPLLSRLTQFDQNNNHFKDFNSCNNNVAAECIHAPHPEATTQLEKDPVPTIRVTKSIANSACDSDTEDAPTHNIYQDNCNYLFNRFCNQENNPTQIITYNADVKKSSLLKPAHSINQKNVEAFNQQQQNYYRSHYIQPRLSNQYRCTTMSYKSQSDSAYTSDSDYEAHLLDFPLLGDDFFLYMARMELKCRFKRIEKIFHSGLCISGQMISNALNRIRKLEYCKKGVIVNIGSVDIMKGRSLIQIQHDFRELLLAMQEKGLKPIVTTLAPLANYAYDSQMKSKLERFNRFLKNEIYDVIDIWSCLVNERGQILFDCFQNEPRQVTGTKEPYLFWNKIGRQRVLQMIESHLEY